jgi:hypothetical protein
MADQLISGHVGSKTLAFLCACRMSESPEKRFGVEKFIQTFI